MQSELKRDGQRCILKLKLNTNTAIKTQKYGRGRAVGRTARDIYMLIR